MAAVLIAESLFFLPSLTHARRDWLDRRLRDGELAAMSATVGTVRDGTRAELLRLAEVRAVRLRRPGQDITLLAAGASLASDNVIDLDEETGLVGAWRALAALVRNDVDDDRLQVRGTSLLQDESEVAVLVRRHDLDAYIAERTLRLGAVSLLVAAVAGLLLYGALMVLLVRPMRRLTESISAFRADPERAAPLAPQGDDEIAVAARELAAMQQELRAALWRNARLAALGTAVAKISHDLRGILSPALLTAERLQMNQEPSIKRAGDTLVRAVERATELVRRTVEFAREIPVAPERRAMALHAAVEEAAEQARIVCPGLAIDNAVPPSLEIDAERASVVRVLSNLLRNAGEAQAHRVRVSAVQEDGAVAVAVADDGPGLPPHVQAALFRPFVAGTRRGSTGLGLAIVRDLVRAHGGEVTLIETGPTGTSFRLTLPRAARAAQPMPAVQPPPARPAA